jgi:hypothetical protein
MRTFLRRSTVATALIALLPSLAQAHPGHDGGEVTWDFTHLAAHPFATMGWLVAIGGVAWIVGRITAPRVERSVAVKSVDDRASDQS